MNTMTQYETRVPRRVREHTEALMRNWREGGRDDEQIENVVRAAVLHAFAVGEATGDLTYEGEAE